MKKTPPDNVSHNYLVINYLGELSVEIRVNLWLNNVQLFFMDMFMIVQDISIFSKK